MKGELTIKELHGLIFLRGDILGAQIFLYPPALVLGKQTLKSNNKHRKKERSQEFFVLSSQGPSGSTGPFRAPNNLLYVTKGQG